MSKQAGVDMKVTAKDERPPFVVAEHPITKTPILLVDPELAAVKHPVVDVICDDAVAFADAVHELQGANSLVELTRGADFIYHDALGDALRYSVAYHLEASPTAQVLCLSRDFTKGQRDLVRWGAQWPGTLVPQGEQPEVAWEMIAAYQAKGTKSVAISHGDQRVSVQVERDDHAEGPNLPRLWTATSPVFEGHAPQTVTLRLDITHPEADTNTGQVSGQLTFGFSLWQPASTEVVSAAMNDACEQMRARLPEFTIIRGKIG